MKNMHKIAGLIALIVIIGCGYYLYQRSKLTDNVVVQQRCNRWTGKGCSGKGSF